MTRLVTGNLGTGTVEGILFNSARHLMENKTDKYFEDISPLLKSRDDFNNALRTRNLSKPFINFLLRNYHQNDKLVNSDEKYIHFIYQPKNKDSWGGDCDPVDLNRVSGTIGNVVLTSNKRRIRNTNSWSSFRENYVLSGSVDGWEELDQYFWNQDSINSRNNNIATKLTEIWYGA